MRSLLSRRTSDGCAQLARGTKVRCAIGVEVNPLRHGVAVAIAGSSAVGSSMVHIPDLLAIGADEEAMLLSACVHASRGEKAYPLCPGP